MSTLISFHHYIFPIFICPLNISIIFVKRHLKTKIYVTKNIYIHDNVFITLRSTLGNALVQNVLLEITYRLVITESKFTKWLCFLILSNLSLVHLGYDLHHASETGASRWCAPGSHALCRPTWPSAFFPCLVVRTIGFLDNASYLRNTIISL